MHAIVGLVRKPMMQVAACASLVAFLAATPALAQAVTPEGDASEPARRVLEIPSSYNDSGTPESTQTETASDTGDRSSQAAVSNDNLSADNSAQSNTGADDNAGAPDYNAQSPDSGPSFAGVDDYMNQQPDYPIGGYGYPTIGYGYPLSSFGFAIFAYGHSRACSTMRSRSSPIVVSPSVAPSSAGAVYGPATIVAPFSSPPPRSSVFSPSAGRFESLFSGRSFVAPARSFTASPVQTLGGGARLGGGHFGGGHFGGVHR